MNRQVTGRIATYNFATHAVEQAKLDARGRESGLNLGYE